MTAETHKTAGAVIIGNEILSGKVREENAPYLIATLRELGVSLRRIAVIQDTIAEIGQTVRQFSELYDYVFTSGGVGPTHDDITMAGVAAGFGVELYEHPELLAVLAKRHPLGLTVATRRMATIPVGSDVFFGGEYRWPVITYRNVTILPGVPLLFRAKLDAIRDRLRAAPFHCANVYVKLDESVLAPWLEQVLAEHAGLEIGSYPRFDEPDYRVRLTLEHADPAALDTALDALLALIPGEEVHEIDRGPESVPL